VAAALHSVGGRAQRPMNPLSRLRGENGGSLAILGLVVFGDPAQRDKLPAVTPTPPAEPEMQANPEMLEERQLPVE
jgi:hypothetical protein